MMQTDWFGMGTSVTDILGDEHSSFRAMLESWERRVKAQSGIDVPPHFMLGTNPVAVNLATSERDVSIRLVDPGESVIAGNRNSAIYRLFNYHTKVNPEIAWAFIETYSEPGQIVLDPFCGSGMLGLGAHHGLESEHYRKAILSDLSPAAAHLAWAYNCRPQKSLLKEEGRRIVAALKSSVGTLYGATPIDQVKDSRDPWEYQVWSDIVRCPSCETETPFIELEGGAEIETPPDIFDDYEEEKVPLDYVNGEEENELACPNCDEPFAWNSSSNHKGWQRVVEEVFDTVLGQNRKIVCQTLCHTFYKANKRLEDRSDSDLESECEQSARSMLEDLSVPKVELPDGANLNQPKRSHGLTHVHHFYTTRNLVVLAAIHREVECAAPEVRHVLRQAALSLHPRGSLRNRYLQKYKHRHVGVQSGTLYVPPVREEPNLIRAFERRVKRVMDNLGESTPSVSPVIVGVQSATNLEQVPDNSIDYVLTDPPFGANINYSDLNFLGEAWLDAFTDTSQEAIINKTQEKDLGDYGNLMKDSFVEMFRVLRSGAFLTVIFQNSDNEVWNEIHRGLVEVGFETHDVVAVDKGKGTLKALSSDHGTGQDIAITMRKAKGLEVAWHEMNAPDTDDVWGYLDELVSNSPQDMPTRGENGTLNPRHVHALYPMMLRFYLSRSLEVPYTVAEFLEELQNRYTIEDGLVIGGVG